MSSGSCLPQSADNESEGMHEHNNAHPPKPSQGEKNYTTGIQATGYLRLKTLKISATAVLNGFVVEYPDTQNCLLGNTTHSY